MEPDRQFHFMMGESALSSRVAEPIHMLAQVERLRPNSGSAEYFPEDHPG